MGYLKWYLNRKTATEGIFQFPLWDTLELNLRLVVVLCFFQFPLWDTVYIYWFTTMLLQLLSIPFMGYLLRSFQIFLAQFFPFNSLYGILYLFFYFLHSLIRTFNSLYGIRFSLALAVMWLAIAAFNSLYGILKKTLKKNMNLMNTFNSLYGIQVRYLIL